MNLIYLHTHDTGRCYESYGYPVKTPNEMELAQRSLQFNNAYCCAPTCSPSRAALLTGVTPHNCGMLGLAHRGFSLSDKRMHLAAWLRENGFETALCGVQHEAKNERDLPYEHFLTAGVKLNKQRPAIQYDLDNCQIAEAFLREKHERPFFLSFGLRNTHRPYPDRTRNPDYLRPPFPVPSTRDTRGDAADFAAAVETVDACIGKILSVLSDTGLNENTAVLFTTDHGPAFPRMKCTLYDGGTGVALLLSFPGNPRAGQATDCLISHLDVYPTLCGILGVPTPEWAQGVSLLPLTHEERAVRGEAFSEVTYHAAYEPMRAVRTERYKLIRRYDWHNGVVPANIDASPSKTVMAGAGLLEETRAREELYDLLLDPTETNNRVMDRTLAPVYRELSEKLISWMRETGDPLLTCSPRVPKPEGTRVNALAAVNPDDDCWE